MGITMKEFLKFVAMAWIVIISICAFAWGLTWLDEQGTESGRFTNEKTRLEIEKLRYELKLYKEQEDIDKKSVE